MAMAGQDEPVDWPPEGAIFDARSWGRMAEDRTVLLRHPSTPYMARAVLEDFAALQTVATSYVVAADRAAGLGLPAEWLDSLANADGKRFGWLPIDPDPPEATTRPIASRYIRRLRLHEDGHDNIPFRAKPALLLLATYRDDNFVLGSELGIRLVLVLGEEQEVGTGIRITGLSAAIPPQEEVQALLELSSARLRSQLDFLAGLRPALARATALDPETVFFRGVRPLPADRLRVRARGLKPKTQGGLPYEFLADTSLDQEIRVLAKAPLIADAIGPVRIIPSDPASQGSGETYRRRRPSRANLELQPFGVAQGEPNVLQRAGRVVVRQSRFVLGDNFQSAAAKQLAVFDPNLPTRSNSQSAVATLRNLCELFDRMDRYGIDPALYFRHAALPLLGYYRSGVSPGPGKDGQTINARVLPQGWEPNAIFPPNPLDRPILEVHLALGDLIRRERWPFVPNAHPSQAVPVGIATDTRFVWHELGHVLLMAALGQLEFNFAHSMGDALVAITADPGSRLPFSPAGYSPAWRGWTFPWVFVPRRHDRSLLDGWGWAGLMGQELRQTPQAARLHLKGYWTEQILSTTLFLLYRSLGGEPSNLAAWQPEDLRYLAADYVVYLIMTSLEVLGNPLVVPAAVAEQFAAALSEADELTVATVAEDGQGNLVPRIGGCATKVVRWIFEAHGMYPPDPDRLYTAPGLPPDVDVYIPDRRPTALEWGGSQVEYGPGSYVPVPLRWDVGHLEPGWLAHPDAITVAGGDLQVTVGNRGTAVARNVSVELWLIDWPAGDPPGPAWNRPAWQPVLHNQVQDIPANETRQFGPIALPAAAGRRLVLAQANCADDRSIIDPVLGWSCANNPTALSQLVPGDNNLGLAVLG